MMTNIYTNSEITDMDFIYSKANGNVIQTVRLYQEAYPNGRQQENVF